MTVLLYLWPNKCKFGEHKTLLSTTTQFYVLHLNGKWMYVYIFTYKIKVYI